MTWRNNGILFSLLSEQMQATLQMLFLNSVDAWRVTSVCLQVNPIDYITVWCFLTLACDKILKFTFLQEINVEWRCVPKKLVANCIFPTSSRDTLLSWVPHRTASVFLFQSCYCKTYPIGFHCPKAITWPHQTSLEGLNCTTPWKDLWFGIWFFSSCAQSSLKTKCHHSLEKVTI